MTAIICALLAVGAIGFTLLVRDQDVPPAPVENPELKHLETRRQVLYENLKDLQFEYHQGKLSDGDYQGLKAGFLSELSEIMASIEKLSAAEQPSKRPLPQTPQKKAPVKKPGGASETECPSCSAVNAATNRFCGQCGAQMA